MDRPPPPLPAPLSWKDVLDEKTFGAVWNKSELALAAGYKYFVHNGLVYEVDHDHSNRGYIFYHGTLASVVVK